MLAAMSGNPPYFAPAGSGGDRGDKAGEHLDMQRGRYGAGMYVFVAFVYEVVLIGLPVFLVLNFAVGRIMLAAYEAGHYPPHILTWVPWIAGVTFGLPIAWLVFHDRWKTIEAFSSRYCSGVANLSLLYVPVVALVYANVRGVKKLGGG